MTMDIFKNFTYIKYLGIWKETFIHLFLMDLEKQRIILKPRPFKSSFHITSVTSYDRTAMFWSSTFHSTSQDSRPAKNSKLWFHWLKLRLICQCFERNLVVLSLRVREKKALTVFRTKGWPTTQREPFKTGYN